MIPRPTRVAIAVWLLVLAVAGVLIVSSASRASAAASSWAKAARDADRARAIAQEIIDLQAKAPAWLTARREEEKLSPRITATLAACGLPAQTLASFNLQRETNLGGKDVRAVRERAVCSLMGLTLPQLGRFVEAWRTREPSWTMTRFEIAPINERGPIAGGDIPLRVTLSIESLFVNDGGE